MWGLFTRSDSKPLSLEQRIDDYYTRLHVFISSSLEAAGSPKSDLQLINSPELSESLNGLLAVLITEDQGQSEGLDFGSGMTWVLSKGYFDQLVAWAQLDQPYGMFAKVVYFFTLLVMDIRNQALIQHQAFNRALLNLLFMTNERIKRGQVFAEAEITTVPLIHAISRRVAQEPSLASCFTTKEAGGVQYVLVPILQFFMTGERAEENLVLECVVLLGQVEDEDVINYVRTESQLLQLVSHRLIKPVSNLPKTWSKATPQRPKELDEICRYLLRLDEFCEKCLHTSLIDTLCFHLLSDCFQPYISPYLTSEDVECRSAFTRYLLHMVYTVTSQELVLCVGNMIRTGNMEGGEGAHHRIESSSTMVSGSTVAFPSYPSKPSPSPSIWPSFISNLQSPHLILRLNSIKLLYILLQKGRLRMIKLLITDSFSGEIPVGFTGCSYERFLSNFPGSLLHSDVKNTVFYYYESLESIFLSDLPQFEHFSCPSFMSKHGYFPSNEQEIALFRSQDLYGSQTSEESNSDIDYGPIMDYLLGKIEAVLTNTTEENALITGILTMLCRIPALNMTSSILFFLLFSLVESKGLLNRLKKVKITQIDTKIMKMSSEASNFEGALNGARRALGVEIDPGLPADRNYMEFHLKEGSQLGKKVRDSHFIEVFPT